MSCVLLGKLYENSHWSLANSSVIQAALDGVKPIYGPRGKMVRRSIGLVWSSPMTALFIMRLIGCMDISRWWILSMQAKQHRFIAAEPCRFFVGFGAGSEEFMWQKFQEEDNNIAVRLDQTQPSSFGTVYRPSLLKMYKAVWRESRIAFNFLKSNELETVSHLCVEFVTYATLRLGTYAYFLNWWKELPINIKDVVFISADIPAFACLDAGVEHVTYWQHGLMRKSVLMPRFDKFHLLTKAEINYYGQFFPPNRMVLEHGAASINQHRRVILLSSCYETEAFRKKDFVDSINELVDWANEFDVEIIVRKHPREVDDFWTNFFSQLCIDSVADSFEEALTRIRPMMMVTWFSTTLIDALRFNVVPISISSMEDDNVRDLVMNLHDSCLIWPESREILNQLLTGDTTVEAVISSIGLPGDIE